jgi:ribonuclease HII
MIIIGVDEAGRGPLFGSVYTSAVILPEENFDLSLLKDSKRFTSKKKIKEVYDYISTNALYSIDFMTHDMIDKLNILQATQKSMHKSIFNIITKYINLHNDFTQDDFQKFHICVDGNYFNDFMFFFENKYYKISHECMIKGDDKCKSISAASILAKVSRDNYIDEFVSQYPEYEQKYHLSKNKGYGTKQHLDGIRTHGYSTYHRKSFKVKSIT